MYKIPKYSNNGIKRRVSVEGETIERKIEKMIANKEPIKAQGGTGPMYTERKDGVIPSTNIRTDRWQVAVEGADKIARSYEARREERMNPKKVIGKPESIQGDQQDPKIPPTDGK